ncbi:hypothetical protein PG985_000706 [Apiospora marii]|uniref:uncharacterized protein n=1 Tax=Apiospora marii TaxID=335849 RepID=UPI0031314DD0
MATTSFRESLYSFCNHPEEFVPPWVHLWVVIVLVSIIINLTIELDRQEDRVHRLEKHLDAAFTSIRVILEDNKATRTTIRQMLRFGRVFGLREAGEVSPQSG